MSIPSFRRRPLTSRYSFGDDTSKNARSKLTFACGAFTITSRSISSGDANCADGECPPAPSARIDCRPRRVLQRAAASGFQRTAPACRARSRRSRMLVKIDFERAVRDERSHSRPAAAAEPRGCRISGNVSSSRTASTQPRGTGVSRAEIVLGVGSFAPRAVTIRLRRPCARAPKATSSAEWLPIEQSVSCERSYCASARVDVFFHGRSFDANLAGHARAKRRCRRAARRSLPPIVTVKRDGERRPAKAWLRRSTSRRCPGGYAGIRYG